MASCKFWAIATAVTMISLTGLVTSSRAQGVVASDKVPDLDMRPVCQGAANVESHLAVGEPTFQRCMREEDTARRKLQGVWKTFPASDRNECRGAIQIGGPPSYVDLFWCLQDAKGARALQQGRPDPLPEGNP